MVRLEHAPARKWRAADWCCGRSPLQGKHDEALRQLANDVYFSSLQVGPEHIETAGGYYYIATVFYLKRRIDCALAMCDKVVDIWLKHVSGLLNVNNGATGDSEQLGESQLMDGLWPSERRAWALTTLPPARLSTPCH